MSPTIFRLLATGLAMLATVEAVPSTAPRQNPPGSNTQQFLINYNFETYPQTSAGQVPVVATVVNDYDLLHFNTILVNETSPTFGVPCHTMPVCTAFTADTGLLDGLLTPGQNPVALGSAYITAAYQYSPISYFDPYVFYYGCVAADQNGAASVAVPCNITATGQNAAGKTIYSQTFQFKPAAGALVNPMVLGYFDQGWAGLQIRTLFLSVTNNLTTAALIDNFVASVFGPQNAAVLVDF